MKATKANSWAFISLSFTKFLALICLERINFPSAAAPIGNFAFHIIIGEWSDSPHCLKMNKKCLMQCLTYLQKTYA